MATMREWRRATICWIFELVRHYDTLDQLSNNFHVSGLKIELTVTMIRELWA